MSNLAGSWATLLVRSLVESGVRRFVVCPGSRSTPLALALAAHAEVELVPVIDERSGGFVALGMARATGEPAGILCTSGTAAAHLFPAVVEASEARHPLVVLTADRPWEAHGVGSPQTIDQTRLYGEHVRASIALGPPEASEDALRALARSGAQAVSLARGPRRGPVHVNVPFRKPLEPVPGAAPEPYERRAADLAIPRAHAAVLAPDETALATLEKAVRRSRRGVILAGPRLGAPARPEDMAAVRALSLATGFPLLAEATSGLRFGAGDACVGAFDAFLRVPAIASALQPDLALQLGSAPLSPAVGDWLRASGTPVLALGDAWSDPFGVVSEVVPGDPVATVRALSARLTCPEPPDPDWRAAFALAESGVWDALDAMPSGPGLGEPAIARAAVAAIPERGWLLVGNSRPVRDLDSFVAPAGRFVAVHHQRGAAGIDGLVAGAAGASRATGAPGVLLLGDVSLAHDLGSLAVARDARAPLAILAIDNGGGRIFDELPIAAIPSLAEERARLFTTAPRLDWAHAAATFGMPFAEVADAPALEGALAGALARPGATLVVARSSAEGEPPRRRLHRAVAAAGGGRR